MCNITISSKQQFREHKKTQHPKVISCEQCQKTFDQSWKLEMHMKSHDTIKPISCDQCEQKIYVDWRLEKHKKMHSNKKFTFCHYFNNKKVCPYKEIGCKFLHKKSNLCIMKDRCLKNLCQYQHEKNSHVDAGKRFKSDSSNKISLDHEDSKKRSQQSYIDYDNLEMSFKDNIQNKDDMRRENKRNKVFNI